MTLVLIDHALEDTSVGVAPLGCSVIMRGWDNRCITDVDGRAREIDYK